MAGVMNHTARQYNLKAEILVGGKKQRVTVRIAPAFNIVDDEHWKHVKGIPLVLKLKKEGKISFGSKVDDLELEQDADTKCKSKVVALPATPKHLETEFEV